LPATRASAILLDVIDDTPDRRRYFEHLARLTPAERFAIQVRLVRDGRELARAGI
jgi:hypothetical protein